MAGSGVPKLIDRAMKLKEALEEIGKPLPGGITIEKLDKLIKEVEDRTAKADSLKIELRRVVNEKNLSCKNLREFIAQAKLAVKVEFGADSSEYEMAGGTRTSERKKPGRRKKEN